MSSRDDRRATWQRLLAEQRASGLSIVSWCWQQGIQENTFYYWRKRLAEPVTPEASPSWMPVTLLPTAGTGGGLTVRVGAAAIEVAAGFDPELLAAVVTVLAARC
jgi:hypothetical protein